MINPSTAPTSPNPMPAGLGALTQMSPTPKGKSPSNMGQIMELARNMSDAQLADVLQGKSLDVPQFAAMTEAMGRKSLRNAVQGMEAQGQAHQPSLKDKMLAEDATQQMPEASGIGQIPAPNMESMHMASGGIIAFDDGGDVEARRKAAMDVINQNMPEKAPSGLDMPLTDYYNLRNKALRAIDTNMPLPVSRESMEARQATYGNKFAPPPVNTDKGWSDSETANPKDALPPNTYAPPLTAGAGNQQQQQLNAGVNPNARVNPDASNLMKPANGLSGVDAELARYSDKFSKMFPEAEPFVKRDNPFSAVKYEGDSADKTREQGLGTGLMLAASSFLKNPTFAGGLGDAMAALGNQGWVTAKEVKAAKKEERDFNKEMAKASELFEQGQEDKAYKTATLAQNRQDKISSLALNAFKANTDLFSAQDLSSYHKGSLDVQRMQANKPDSGLAMLHALQDPKNMAIYQQMYSAKNPKLGTVSPEFSLKEYNDNVKDNPNFKKQFPTPQSYYNYVNPQQQPKFLGFEQ